MKSGINAALTVIALVNIILIAFAPEAVAVFAPKVYYEAKDRTRLPGAVLGRDQIGNDLAGDGWLLGIPKVGHDLHFGCSHPIQRVGKGVQLRRGDVQFQAIRHDLSLLSFLYQS